MSEQDWQDRISKGLPHDTMHDGTIVLTETEVDEWKRTLRSATRPAPPKPKWDGEARSLYVGDQLVKRFRQPAGNQERVLAAFEEAGWPQRIDDPIPPSSRIPRQRRLSNTMAALRGHHRTKAPLIRFEADGTGTGVIWMLLPPSSAGAEE